MGKENGKQRKGKERVERVENVCACNQATIVNNKCIICNWILNVFTSSPKGNGLINESSLKSWEMDVIDVETCGWIRTGAERMR